VHRCDAGIIGKVIRDLGGGRLNKESVIDPEVGIDRLAKPGEPVTPGGLLCRIHASIESSATEAETLLAAAFTLTDDPPAPTTPIVEVL